MGSGDAPRGVLAERPPHAVQAREVLSGLSSSDSGVSADEIERRRARFGRNELPEPKRPGLLRIFLRLFRDPLIYILRIAVVVALAIGIEEGRVAYDNVRKVTWLLLATGAGEVLLFFLAVGLGLPLPLLPVQLLWLNLVTNGIQDVALAFEKAEPGVLDRKPRDPSEPVFDRRMVRHVVSSGAYIGLAGFAVFYWLVRHAGMEVTAARNVLLLLMVLLENVHIFSCRSEERSAFKVPLSANPLLIAAVVAAHGVHIAAMYVPGLSDVLEVSPVTLETWLTLLPIALSLLLFDEGVKLLGRRRRGALGQARSHP